MPSTFISYRRDDAAGYAGRLHEALERRLGGDLIFRDVDTLEPGQDFVDAIESRLQECRVFLALIGRGWLDAKDAVGRRRLDQSDDYVRLEIAGALARPDVRVIPVLIEGAVMPPPDALPESIRPLARRHAVSLRDDAWDHDVDRLASAIDVAAGPGARAATTARTAPTATFFERHRRLAFAAAGMALLALFLVRSGDNDDEPVVPRDPPASSGASPVDRNGRDGVPGAPVDSQPYGVAVPDLAEVVHPALIYTLLSANVTPLGNGTSELRLRFRFSNEGRYDANAWDASFRLASGNAMLAPTGGLNQVVASHSITQGIVTFTMPSDAGRVVLRIMEGDRVAEVPLDVSPTKRPVEDERRDAGDALSRAVIRTFVEGPRMLLPGDGLSVEVVRGTSRRFANAVRLTFALRYTNTGPYPAGARAVLLRLAAGDQVLAPVEWPDGVIQPASNLLADAVFEVPPSTPRAILRGSVAGVSGELPFDVP